MNPRPVPAVQSSLSRAPVRRRGPPQRLLAEARLRDQEGRLPPRPCGRARAAAAIQGIRCGPEPGPAEVREPGRARAPNSTSPAPYRIDSDDDPAPSRTALLPLPGCRLRLGGRHRLGRPRPSGAHRNRDSISGDSGPKSEPRKEASVIRRARPVQWPGPVGP